MPLVQLALDGSWDSAEARIFAYGGVAGLMSNWFALGEKWSEALEPYGLESFHMVHAMNFRGDFGRLSREWGEQRLVKRQELLETLVSVVCDHTNLTAMGIGAEVRILGEQKKAVKKKEMFQAVVLEALATLDPSYRVGIMCDREQDAAASFLGWVDNLILKHPQHRERLWALCFVDDRVVPAVQVADMWTYLLRENTERQAFQPELPENPLFTRLLAATGERRSGRSTRPEFLRDIGE